MAMNNPYQQYQENSVMAAKPEELTLMLYSGAIKFLNQAKMNIQNNDIEKANNNIVRAEDILTELMSTLDESYEVSQNLYSLYEFMHNWLMQANIKKDEESVQKIDQVVTLLKDLRDTWKDAIKLASSQQTSSNEQESQQEK